MGSSCCSTCQASLCDDGSCPLCPDEANAPIDEETYLNSIGVELQCDVDDAIREGYHVTGLRPYRVFLVWRKRGRDQIFDIIRSIELMPVRLEAMDSTDLELMPLGLNAEGGITLTEISPRQVSELDLRGKIDGKDLPHDTEFFYEVRKRPFPGQPEHPPRRYILASEPHHDAESFEFVVNLQHQKFPTSPAGEDTQMPKRPQLRHVEADV